MTTPLPDDTTSEARMGIDKGRPGWGSAVGRALLGVWALVLLVTLFPENLRTWSDPNTSVLPSERTMPVWGNVVMMAVMGLTVVALITGWVVRRRIQRPKARTMSAVAWIAMTGQALWAASLGASLALTFAPAPEAALIGTGAGVMLDGVVAVLAIATASILGRDAVRLSPDRARTQARRRTAAVAEWAATTAHELTPE